MQVSVVQSYAWGKLTSKLDDARLYGAYVRENDGHERDTRINIIIIMHGITHAMRRMIIPPSIHRYSTHSHGSRHYTRDLRPWVAAYITIPLSLGSLPISIRSTY